MSTPAQVSSASRMVLARRTEDRPRTVSDELQPRLEIARALCYQGPRPPMNQPATVTFKLWADLTRTEAMRSAVVDAARKGWPSDKDLTPTEPQEAWDPDVRHPGTYPKARALKRATQNWPTGPWTRPRITMEPIPAVPTPASSARSPSGGRETSTSSSPSGADWSP